MAGRDHGRIFLSIWDDDDWCALPPDAQHLWIAFMTSRHLSYAGVLTYTANRFTRLAKGLTVRKIEATVATLEAHRFVVVDRETAELLVRSFVRRDGMLSQPNVCKAMVSAYTMIESDALREVLLEELRRAYREDPEAKGWKGVAEINERLLDEIQAKPFREPFGKPFPEPFAEPFRDAS